MKIKPERLKELRRDVKEWSRQKLAAESKVSARQIARIESSAASVTVRSTTAKRLARAFDVSEEVLGGNEPVDTARLTPMQRQASKLGANADALSGNKPSSDRQINLKIDSSVQLAYDLVEHCYPYSPGLKGIVNLAPLFFVLLAEGSLDWRKKCLEEIRRASDHLYETAKAENHLYFTKYLTSVEDGYGAEKDSIEKTDICGETIRNDDSVLLFADADESLYGLNPFMAYLRKFSRDTGILDKAFPIENSDDPWGPESYIYLFLKKELEEITGGSHNAEWALRFGDVRLSEIPEELMPGEEKDDHKNERIAWLEGKLSDESRAKLTVIV